jgi:hypothetical protein
LGQKIVILTLFALASLAQKEGEVVYFSALPKNEPLSPPLREQSERKGKNCF